MTTQKTNKRYITVKGQGTRQLAEYTENCKEKRLPIVYARGNGKKYLFVEMDLIFVENSQFYNESTTFKLRMQEAIEEITGRKYDRLAMPGLYTAVKRVPKENAEKLMQLFLYFYDRVKGLAKDEESETRT